MRNVNNILRRNRTILFELISSEKEIFEKEELSLRGYNFKFYTNSWQVNKGENYFFVYDCGFIEFKKNLVKVVFVKEKQTSAYLFEARQ